MKLSKFQKDTLSAIIYAAKHNRLALLDCKDNATGKPEAVLCLAMPEQNGDTTFIPVGHIIREGTNPFAQYSPPGDEPGTYRDTSDITPKAQA